MRGKRVLFIQHGDVDKAGLFGEILEDGGAQVDVVHPYAGESLPSSLEGYAGLGLGGGAQSAYEREKYPYFTRECELIREAASAGKPAMGLCLGAQLMATALGAEVRKAPRREIGLLDIMLESIADFDPVWNSLPKTLTVTHWHGDTFDIPPGGMHMASSAMTANQLFRYGSGLYGLQFHLEMTPHLLDELVDDSSDYLREAGVDPEAIKQRGWECLPALRESAELVFTRWGEMLS